MLEEGILFKTSELYQYIPYHLPIPHHPASGCVVEEGVTTTSVTLQAQIILYTGIQGKVVKFVWHTMYSNIEATQS